MTLSHRLRTVSLAAALITLATPPAAQASLILGPAQARHAASSDTAWHAPIQPASLPAGAASWRIQGPQATDCHGCGTQAPQATGRRGSTLSVNIAILVLGTLWVGLMLRRIQLRSAVDGLRNAGPPHAAGGH